MPNEKHQCGQNYYGLASIVKSKVLCSFTLWIQTKNSPLFSILHLECLLCKAFVVRTTMDWNVDSGIDFKVNKRILTNNYSINFKNIILIVLILFEINWDKLEYSNKYSKAWSWYSWQRDRLQGEQKNLNKKFKALDRTRPGRKRKNYFLSLTNSVSHYLILLSAMQFLWIVC